MATPFIQSVSLGPFSDSRWYKSPTAEEISSGCHLGLSDVSPISSLVEIPLLTVETDAYDNDDTESDIGPVTPGTPVRRGQIAAYQSSPFWDERWRVEADVDEWDAGWLRDRTLKELLISEHGHSTRTSLDGRTRLTRGQEVLTDEQDRLPMGFDGGRDGRRSEKTAGEESEGEDDGWCGLRRNLWPERYHRLEDTHTGGRILEEESFWLSRDSALDMTTTCNAPTKCSPPAGPPSPTFANRLAGPPPATGIDIAAHLSSRLGHTKMLEKALGLVDEHMMGGLSLFLYCPKRHVRDVWSADKIWETRDKFDALDRASPGFKKRIFVHSHETMNLACHPPDHDHPVADNVDSAVYRQTMGSLRIEMRTLELLGLRYLVVHPGSSSRCGGRGDNTRTLQLLARNIDQLLEEHPTMTIVLESMACKNGRMVGTSLSSLSLIRSFSAYPTRIKFCIDLCHIHAMSHNLSTEAGRRVFYEDVEIWLGYENVVCAHVSDSAMPHGSGRGRHADFGSGYIGDQAFRDILRHPSLSHITWIIETPRYLPHDLTNQAIETLEVHRQVLDIEHLRWMSSMTEEEWADDDTRGKMQERREDHVKRLRKEMRRAAGKEGGSKREMEERVRQSRKRRGRISRAVARARHESDAGCGFKRSPKREQEANLARERYKQRRMKDNGGARIRGSLD